MSQNNNKQNLDLIFELSYQTLYSMMNYSNNTRNSFNEKYTILYTNIILKFLIEKKIPFKEE